MKKAHLVLALLLGLLGVGHVSCTLLFYRKLDIDASWFVGAGLSLVYLAILNVVIYQSGERWKLGVATIANLFGQAYTILLAVLLVEPQAYLGVLLATALLGISAVRWFRTISAP